MSTTSPVPAHEGRASEPAFVRRGPALALAALLSVHAALLTWSATAASVCFDEYAHLPAGLSYLAYREFGVYNVAPPLPRLWQAAPAMLLAPEIPALDAFRSMALKDRYWAYGEAFLRANVADYQRLYVVARLAMIPLSCFGAWVVYRWARSLYGAGGGLAAATAYVFCPNVCAHASLVGTDAATVVAFVTAAWLWWRFCRDPGWTNLALATIAVAATHLCKFSALLLWPAMGLIAACVAVGEPHRPWRRLLAGLVLAGFGTVLLVNAGYLFEGTGKRAASFELRSHAMRSIFELVPADLRVPLPEPLVTGFDELQWEVEQGFPGFLLGEQYRGSRWWYFPVALALKLPLATIVLIVLSVATMCGAFGARPPTADEWALVAALLVVLIGLMMLAGVDLGVRYILPAVPFAFVLVGRAWSSTRDRPWLRWAVPALLAGIAAANASIAPRYLTFFNVLAGGSDGQYLLNDSNYDWGQGLLDLKGWMDANGVSKVHLGYFGRVDPAVYGIDYDLLTDPSDAPYVAVSSYYLVGLSHRLPSHDGPAARMQISFHRELQRLPRVAVPGGVIHVFRTEDVADAVAAHRAAASEAH